MDGRCETCKWWDRSNRRVPAEARGTSDRQQGLCRKTDLHDPDESAYDSSRMVIYVPDVDDDDLAMFGGKLYTTDDFGCVQWEANV